MSTTPTPLLWDVVREVSSEGYPGTVVHFFDEEGQSLYVDGGFQTIAGEVPEGHWKDNPFEDAYSIDSTEYIDTDFDHPYNGVLYGVAVTDEGLLQFLRYQYLVDCTNILRSGTLDYKNDSSIVQFKATIENIGADMFTNEVSLFQPGAKATLKVIVGNSSPYPLSILYLDSIDFSFVNETVSIAARNSMSRLVEATFGDDNSLTGTADEIAEWILSLAGINRHHIQPGGHVKSWEFDPDATLFKGLNQLCEYYIGWKVVELPDGSIAIGYAWWIATYYQANSYYIFDQSEVFKRSIKQSSDAAYTKVRVTGKSTAGVDLDPVTLSVENYTYWDLPENKIYHVEAPSGYTQEELQTYAEQLAESLQYIGIVEAISGPFRPQLLVGDVAAIDIGNGMAETLGIITSIRHKMGRTGFFTEFNTDSGGVQMDEQTRIVTETKAVSGYNRKQTIKDMISIISKSS